MPIIGACWGSWAKAASRESSRAILAIYLICFQENNYYQKIYRKK
jgi:hypothetical protein